MTAEKHFVKKLNDSDLRQIIVLGLVEDNKINSKDYTNKINDIKYNYLKEDDEYVYYSSDEYNSIFMINDYKMYIDNETGKKDISELIHSFLSAKFADNYLEYFAKKNAAKSLLEELGINAKR